MASLLSLHLKNHRMLFMQYNNIICSFIIIPWFRMVFGSIFNILLVILNKSETYAYMLILFIITKFYSHYSHNTLNGFIFIIIYNIMHQRIYKLNIIMIFIMIHYLLCMCLVMIVLSLPLMGKLPINQTYTQYLIQSLPIAKITIFAYSIKINQMVFGVIFNILLVILNQSKTFLYILLLFTITIFYIYYSHNTLNGSIFIIICKVMHQNTYKINIIMILIMVHYLLYMCLVMIVLSLPLMGKLPTNQTYNQYLLQSLPIEKITIFAQSKTYLYILSLKNDERINFKYKRFNVICTKFSFIFTCHDFFNYKNRLLRVP